VRARNNIPSANQQNIANHFSLLWIKLISWSCVRDILNEKEVSFYRHPRFNANINGRSTQIVAL
jgi:hypothetical protein